MSRDDELDDELESHLCMAIEERTARGESRTVLLVALAAGYLPARRASRVEVLTALQE